MSYEHPGAQPPPRRAWLSAALLCAALLILPGIAWLLAPRPSRFALPAPRPARTEAAAQVAAPAPPPPRESAPAPPPPREPAPDAPVAGVILDPQGKPLSGAAVRCDDRDDKELAASSDDDGRFKLPAEAAGCLARAQHDAHSPSDQVRLVAGRENVLRLNRGGAIEGTAADEGGRAVSSYLLAIESFLSAVEGGRPPSYRARSIDDPNGAFRLEDLPPGRYVLTASAEGRPPVKSAAIEVEAGRATRNVRIVLVRGATLSGRVIDAETRAPIAGADVMLDSVTSTGANAIAPARTDEAGAYTLEGAPAGPFSIRASREGYRTKIVPGIVARGPQVTQDIALSLRADGGAETELAGIGAILAPTPQGVSVASVVPGGPAEGAGLRSGDVIARIDGADALSLTMTDCVQRLRGPEGSRVRLGVKREEQVVDFLITRQLIVR